MKRILAIFLIFCLVFSACGTYTDSGGEKQAPYVQIAHTIKEVGSAAMKSEDRTISEPYAYEVTLEDSENLLSSGTQSARVVLPYAMFDIGYGTRAEEKYNTLTVFFDEAGKLTPLCGRYVRDLEGVEVFVNKSGIYVVKDNPIKLSIDGELKEPAATLVSRGIMTEDEINDESPLTWDELDLYIAKIFNSDLGTIKRCGFDTGRKYKAGKTVSLQDAAVVIYNSMSSIRQFSEPKHQTRKKVADYAKTAISTFEELEVMPSGDVKKPVDTKKIVLMLAKAYFMFGKTDEANAEITQPTQKNSANGVEVFAPVAALDNSSEYAININGTPVVCEKNLDLTVARFGVVGKFEVEITAKHNLTGVTISPLTLGIVPRIENNTAKFTVEGPQKLYLRMGGPGEDIALFAEDMNASFAKVDANAKIVNLADYKLDNTGKTDITEKLQEILDKASAEKATVYVPDGSYLTRRLKVGGNSSIFFEPSAFLVHKTDFEAAKKLGNTNQTGLLEIFEASNVHIYGYGGIYGRGSEKKAIDNNYCPRNYYIVNSKGITFEGLCSFDAGSWNTHMLESSNIIIRNHKVLNNIENMWTDSIDVDSSNNVLIENCFLRGEDDNIVLKTALWGNTKASPTFEVAAKNNILYSGAGAMKFGTETRADKSYDILYENNYVIRADTSVQITNYDRSLLSNLTFKNNFIELTNSATDKRRQDILIAIKIDDTADSKAGAYPNTDGVLIDGLFVHTKAYQKNKIVGCDDLRRVKNVVIKNYYIAGEKVTTDTFRVETNEFAQFEVR